MAKVCVAATNIYCQAHISAEVTARSLINVNNNVAEIMRSRSSQVSGRFGIKTCMRKCIHLDDKGEGYTHL